MMVRVSESLDASVGLAAATHCAEIFTQRRCEVILTVEFLSQNRQFPRFGAWLALRFSGPGHRTNQAIPRVAQSRSRLQVRDFVRFATGFHSNSMHVIKEEGFGIGEIGSVVQIRYY